MKLNRFVKKLTQTVFVSTGLLFAVTFSVCPMSCRSSVESLELLSGDFSVPKITKFCTTSSNSARIDFSREVELKNTELFLTNEISSLGNAECKYEENSVLLEFQNETVIGIDYKVEGMAFDSSGNSLTFSVPFKGFNSNPAKVIITELRNAYASKPAKGKGRRSEFVELYVLKGGNLSGLEIVSAANGDKTKFVLPAVEVKEGDYVTMHMRMIIAEGLDGEGMYNELGEDLKISTHEDSCDTARDLWSGCTKKPFAASDIVVLRNSNTFEILDAVVFAKSDCTEWKKGISDFASIVSESGIWQGGACLENAVCCDNISPTKSLSRQNLKEAIASYKNGQPIVNGKGCWIVAKTATPGYKNSDIPYIKK
ncbi:hypothetical protein [uncultured Treponema sp.]|uniref:hypothetical protein n=1 Tax=uncultured Treponema sp. TaxID=162155 RepID=UPI000E8B8DFF|nr:hypothetical protein [uncultured Treponema sp.]HAZ95731.1 hypothetical protein [Treponema sp.]